ncbi:MAG: hypothetical protein RBS80_25755 [Thermoguttaceae bacterium]|jgi:hypothetical protein|nr:hypothetical protein [Thermoguttaceae bacterium]
MSAAKRTKKHAFGPAADLLGWAMGRGRVLAAGLVVAGMFFLAWWAVWQRVGPRVTSAERYLLELDRLEATPRPEWIHTDVRAEVYQALRLGGPMNLLDDDLNPRIAEAFARHPWIERVVRVTRLPAAGVQVDLEYRRPVCAVKVGEHLRLVDHRSILLPTEGIPRVELERYPQLAGIESPPVAIPGEPWGDIRVVGGVAVANALLDTWEAWHLARIVPAAVVAPDGRERVHYSLFTMGGTSVAWGLPPGMEGAGEPTTQEKLARLRAYRASHGTFDGPAGPLDLDVRTMPRP